jgi:two-component system phosphate regulon sensor histidine kinase PhoR
MHLCNIFTNLLDNANKYSRETPQITVTTANAGGSLRITVEDNGIGMSEAQQRRIFESFYRVPTGNLHDVKGFGLGLAYVKTMVQAHGGTVEVRSEPGRGSRFEVILPIIGAPRGHSLSSPV